MYERNFLTNQKFDLIKKLIDNDAIIVCLQNIIDAQFTNTLIILSSNT